MQLRFGCLLAVVVSLAAGQGLLDDLVGTWRFIREKSTTGAEEVFKITRTGPNTVREEWISGGKATRTVDHVCDGKDHDRQASWEKGDLETCDASTFDVVTKRGGKERMRVETRLSPDGKTMTRTRTLTQDDKWFHDKLVYERH